MEADPGCPDAKLAGCTCPSDQPRAAENVFRADPECALHGLHLVRAILETENNE